MSEEERWRDEDAHLQRMIDGPADALMAHDQGSRFAEVSACACQSLGYTGEEFLQLRVPVENTVEGEGV